VFQPNLLSNKRILITGGATGLGKSMAQRFLELGATVYICGRREQVLHDAVAELGKDGSGRIKSFSCDVRDAARVEQMINDIWKDGPLDILVNNAAGNFLARTEELSLGAFEAVIGIVLMGTLHCTLACGRRWLKEKHRATVLNITTTYSQHGSAYVVPSGVAKAGVLNLTRSLAVEWGGRGIRLNAIAPGPVPTEGAFSRLMPVQSLEELAKKRNPLGRFGTHEELANLAVFLVSDYSGYINGEEVVMDGGEFLKGASEFSMMGDLLSEEQWQAMKPKKKTPAS
jgi:NAD(P)-dependent dehydrogenase (short-subunit alcohol dehydrogenase family)